MATAPPPSTAMSRRSTQPASKTARRQGGELRCGRGRAEEQVEGSGGGEPDRMRRRLTAQAAASSGYSMALPGCPDKCGNISIPYPFGIGPSCAATSISSYFNLTCNNTFNPPRPMVGDSEALVEVTDISLEHGEMRVLSPVYYICFTANTTFTRFTEGYELKHTPFLPSPSRNRFTVIGCNTLGLIGMGCCEAAIPTDLTAWGAMFEMNQSKVWSFNPCFYAMVSEVGWYSFQQKDLVGHLGFIDDRAQRGAPVVADWAIRNGSCPEEGKGIPGDYACISANSYCMDANNGPGYLCQCSKGYEGNPYLLNGCQDVDECTLRKQDPKYEDIYPCRKGVCHNTPGGYLCKCKLGKRSDGTSVSAIALMALTCVLAMQIQRKRHKKDKDEYFKQNGGLKLYDEMRSRKVDTIRILTEKDIKKATDNYSEDRVLGIGGHGMVYRGTLDDNKEVAIKKSKVINDEWREEFVNEIIILSQINHRNIVRLIGCCLDVHVPMLVYEFVSNGTLSEFLHGTDHRSPIPLDIRLKIATQSAEALAYLHSSTSRTILHGDFKSANILLDGQHNAKVADFGASALKSMNESEFIMFVQGTLGYLDPESFISHCLTDKSDVYSFGVVLLELMTRKRAIFANSINEKESLSYSFLLMFDQNIHRNMLDREIMDKETMVVLEKLSILAANCLRPRGDDRPTMKEVAECLQMIRRHPMHAASDHKGDSSAHHNYEGSSSPSMSAHFDETIYKSIEASRLVQDLVR
uniref:Protein kinase domain-containing protein n=1 Tax=Oryza nivara TaxID=4536 RepID=A0A0E0JCG3_ORYNI